ncbi:CLUMA_CG016389, isoform A [Clunio marinus]|uniref:RNA polymerase II subunit A C-terminal domain phosphatase n=1 Tax=Clunio marinus TaxID=568069 RepID=A0A1J1IT20_9DIPT|nr:CLUMA_CG016389, isoform A [Clunio marinus]
MSESNDILSPNKDIKIFKWVVHEGSQISNGSILCLYQLDGDEKIQRLKNTHYGTVKKLLHKEGETVNKLSPLLTYIECLHTTIIRDLCADCGADLEQIDIASSSKASVPMIHSVPDLKVSEELAKKLGRADTDRLLNDKKLVLLVDLDQTLIHTTNDNVPNNLKDVYHFQLYGINSPWYHTRLRPGTLTFLQNIDPLYELHICTFGARNYAHMICAFLDENGRLFSHRILSRDECLNATSKKDNLKALFPDDCGDSMVCIIDDREDVWNHATNLIQVKPYHFFQHTGDINAPPALAKRELDGKGVDFNKIVKLQKVKGKKKTKEENVEEKIETEDRKEEDVGESSSSFNDSDQKPPKNDETSDQQTEEKKLSNEDYEENLVEIQDPDDYLLYLESILKLIHERFYDVYDKTKNIPDLKLLIPKLKSEVLVGVSIVFSGLVPNIVKLENSRPYLIAKNLGADVTEGITDATTHLIAASTGTQKVFQALKNKKIQVVTPDWLWTCAERWEHVDEKLFPLSSNRNHKMRQIPAHCSPDRLPEPDDVKFNNPYLQMSDNDIASMEAEVEDDESSESDDDEKGESPPEAERVARKRRSSPDENEEEVKKFRPTIDLSGKGDESSESGSERESGGSGRSSSKEDDDDEEESPSAKFRRGEEISSEFELDSNDSVESVEQPGDEEDDGEWNMMGAALEREFLGYED